MEFEKLQMIIAEVLGKDPEQITAEARFVEDLGADSLEVFQMVMGMEDAFDVILEEDVIYQVKRVQDLFDLVTNHGD
ncbi:MAG: acyl carrier protein [Lachnospiraceae bacterium]|nr:acyl carrier protein [Lachnospiraceae bacterium]